MPHSRKIREAFENLEVSFTTGYEIAQNLCARLKAHAEEIQALETAASVPDLLAQLLKISEAGTVAQVTQAAKELTEIFRQSAEEVKKTSAKAEETVKEAFDGLRELNRVVEDLKKRVDEGDSWKGEA